MITNIAVIEDNNDFESYGTSSSFPLTHNKNSRIDLTEMAFITL